MSNLPLGQEPGYQQSEVGIKLPGSKKIFSNGLIIGSLLIFAADTIYRLVNNLSYANQESCLIYQALPRPLFLFWENFIELWLVMVFGVFSAVLLSKAFTKYGRFYPRGPISSFLYGSLMPVCACSTIPLLGTLKGKMKFRTVVTFVMAAPLLSPIIIFLSFSVLGVKYALLRIACSFVLAVGAGYFLELFYRPDEVNGLGAVLGCDKKGCNVQKEGILGETWSIIRTLLPYILLAGTLAYAFNFFEDGMVKFFRQGVQSWYGRALAVVVGVPIYVCNGADVFLLRPLLNHGMLPHGSAIAFSLSASAICIPSIIILGKVLGKRLTSILVGYIAVICLAFGFMF